MGSSQCFVTCESQKIDVHGRHINGHGSRRLSAVDGKKYAAVARQLADRLNGQNRPANIGGVKGDDRFCFLFDCFFKGLGANLPLTVGPRHGVAHPPRSSKA